MRGCAIPGPLKGLKGASIGQRDLIQGGLLMGKHRNSGPGHKRDVAKDRFPHNCSSVTVLPDGIRKDTAVDALSFKKWCSFLTVSVLRTRSPFFSFFTCFFALATELRSFGIASIPFAHSLSWDLCKDASRFVIRQEKSYSLPPSIACGGDGSEFLVGWQLFHSLGTSGEGPFALPI